LPEFCPYCTAGITLRQQIFVLFPNLCSKCNDHQITIGEQISCKLKNTEQTKINACYYNMGKQGIHEEFGKQFFTTTNLEDKDECRMTTQKWIFRNQELTLWTGPDLT
jgi:hypothetical protein